MSIQGVPNLPKGRANMFIDDLCHRDHFATSRDPMLAKVGYRFGDFYGCVPCLFKWFDSERDLADHLLNVELPLFEFDEATHEEIRKPLERLLSRIATDGLSEELRESINGI